MEIACEALPLVECGGRSRNNPVANDLPQDGDEQLHGEETVVRAGDCGATTRRAWRPRRLPTKQRRRRPWLRVGGRVAGAGNTRPLPKVLRWPTVRLLLPK